MCQIDAHSDLLLPSAARASNELPRHVTSRLHCPQREFSGSRLKMHLLAVFFLAVCGACEVTHIHTCIHKKDLYGAHKRNCLSAPCLIIGHFNRVCYLLTYCLSNC